MNIKNFFKRNKYLILIVIAGILLRALFFIAVLHNFGDKGFYPHNSEDAEQYFQLARNFSVHGFFSQDVTPPFSAELVRPPAYPFFLSVFYRIIPAAWFAIIFQNFIALANIILIYALTALIFQKKLVALLAAAIYAIEPGIIYWNNQLLSETLFTFIILFSVYIFVRNIFVNKRHLFATAMASGAMIALATYTRIVAQFILPVFILAGVVVFKSVFKKNVPKFLVFSLLMAVSFIVLSAPWMIRGKILFGTYDFSPSSNSIGFGKYLQMMLVNRGDDVNAAGQSGPNQVRSATFQYIAKHPLTFMDVHLLNAVPFFFGDSYFTAAATIFPSLEKKRIINEGWFSSWGQLPKTLLGHRGAEGILFFSGKIALLTLNSFAIYGAVAWFRNFKERRNIMFFLIILIYYFVLANGVAAYSRLRQPVNPYIYIFAASGIYWLFNLIKKEVSSPFLINRLFRPPC